VLHAISEKLDVKTETGSRGDIQVTTASGFTLVDENNAYTLELSQPSVTAELTGESTFDGELAFSGRSFPRLRWKLWKVAQSVLVMCALEPPWMESVHGSQMMKETYSTLLWRRMALPRQFRV